MDYLTFAEQKKYLVGRNGKEYTGNRISRVVSTIGDGASDVVARDLALSRLEIIAAELSADALEVIRTDYDLDLEGHDLKPWIVEVSAILYKKP